MMKTLLSNFLFLAALLPSPAFSWVPPRSADNPNQIDPDWEPVKTMRQRLGIQYNYTPALLHPEMCRYVSAKDCEAIDGNLQRHAQSHHRRHLQREQNPNLGTVKVLVLLIQFTDHTQDRVLTERSVVENIWKTDVKRWFSENSQGAYEVDPVVVDWVVTDNTETYYSFGVQGRTPELQNAMYPALNQLDADPNWDWSQFDVDSDGQLDAVMMMHSGFDAVTAGPDCKGKDASERIFPHAFSAAGEAWTSADGSVSLNGYAVASAFNGLCDGEPFAIGLTCHEYMHTMGLIDLYDETDTEIAEGLGAWDIMSNPYGPDNSGNNPGFLSAWSREVVEWVTPEPITYDGIYVLKPAETSNHVYQISVNNFSPLPEYLLIENRQQISFDKNLWDAGLMIYHVDDAADGMKNRGYPGQENWPENGNHYRLAVLPKDGSYDLEQNVNKGDAGDMWLPGDELGPGMGNTIFPNTDSYQSSYIFETGITIRVLSQAANRDVVFEVTGLASPPEGTTTSPTPPEAGAVTPAPTPKPVGITSAAVGPATTPAPTPATGTTSTNPPGDIAAPGSPGTTVPEAPGGVHIDATTVFEADIGLQVSSAFAWSRLSSWGASLGLATVLAFC